MDKRKRLEDENCYVDDVVLLLCLVCVIVLFIYDIFK